MPGRILELKIETFAGKNDVVFLMPAPQLAVKVVFLLGSESGLD
jgi:hypothetical protein